MTWNLGSLTSDSRMTLHLTVEVIVRGNELIVNTATVSSAAPDPNTANNSVTLTTKRRAK